MFLTSNMRTMRTRNQKKFRYILVPYGHVIVPLRVPLRILQLVDIQEPVATYSYKRPFQLVSFILVILLVLYSLVCILSKILLDVEDLPIFPSLHYYKAIILPNLPDKNKHPQDSAAFP